MSNFSLNNFARQDLFTCLGVWLTLEVACFALFPAFRLAQPEAVLRPWFLMSLGCGIGGAFLLAGSTELTTFFEAQRRSRQQRFLVTSLALLMSWLGLLGIAFPLFVMGVQLFIGIFALLKA